MDRAYIALGLAILLLLSIMAINNIDIVYEGLRREVVLIDISEELKDSSKDIYFNEDLDHINSENLEEEIILKDLELEEEKVELALLNEEIEEEYAQEELEYLEYLRENFEGLKKEELEYNFHERLKEKINYKKGKK